MKVSLFYLPSIGSRAEIERGMAGLRGDLYQRMLAERGAQAELADALGYDSISFTDAFVGLRTKRMRRPARRDRRSESRREWTASAHARARAARGARRLRSAAVREP